jgi:hypothetical protein
MQQTVIFFYIKNTRIATQRVPHQILIFVPRSEATTTCSAACDYETRVNPVSARRVIAGSLLNMSAE